MAALTGDITQIDLPGHKTSGLIEVQAILKDVPGLEFIYFDERAVVRHELVQKIITAYARFKEDRQRSAADAPAKKPNP